MTGGAHNAVESKTNSVTTFKVLDNHPGITNKAMPFPMSLQPNIFNSGKSSGPVAQIAPRIILDDEFIGNNNKVRNDFIGGDKLKEQELTVEGGTINISSVYSQG